MRILITGANGFIAREIIARLATSGHDIIACVHHTLLESVPHSHVFKMDFQQAITPEHWLPHLDNIDVVINCVGVFHTTQEKAMWAIHVEAPKALFSACVIQKIKKIIHISALGVDKVDVPYARSKLAIDNYLQTLDIPSTIIRPGLVFGKGAYGGSSLFRGLCGLPFIIVMPGKANQLQQPIHTDDLTAIIEEVLTLPGKQILCAVGAEQLSVQQVLIKLRAWLGFKKAWTVKVPNWLIQLGAIIGNCIPNSPMSETGVKMMTVDSIATEAESITLDNTIHIKPRGFSAALNGMVSSVQDRWHARLYCLRPLLRLSIAFIWIWTGIVSTLPAASAYSIDLMTQANIPLTLQPFLLYSFSIIDIILGLAVLLNYRLWITGSIQCVLMVLYTTTLSTILPMYWLHPFAPIAKNIPILVATLIMMALESER